MMTPLCAALWLLLLLPALCSGAAAGKPAAAPPQRFPVFAPCSRAAGDGTDQGLCRAQPWLPQRLAAGPKAKPKEMPIDMRLPCEEAEGSAACHEVRRACVWVAVGVLACWRSCTTSRSLPFNTAPQNTASAPKTKRTSM